MLFLMTVHPPLSTAGAKLVDLFDLPVGPRAEAIESRIEMQLQTTVICSRLIV